MASPRDSLAQAASVLQVTGVDALSGLELVSRIVQAAQDAKANPDLFQELVEHVQIAARVLDHVGTRTPALRRHPATRSALGQLDIVLSEAYLLVKSCIEEYHNASWFYRIYTAREVGSKLRHAQERIDRYTNLSIATFFGVINLHQGRDEGDEDVSNDAASNQRARLSLQDVATSLALEELPPGETYMHKNRLQEFADRTYKKQPIYNVEFEGECHLPKFRCTVEVGGQRFSSAGSFSRKREAEQDAARVAYEILVASAEDDAKEMLGLIDQDPVFCKSILHDFTNKTKTTRPSYSVVCLEKPMTLFRASVVFDGNTYTGESAANKKDAEQKAARAVIKSILATGNTCMMDIIISKKQFISAITAEGSTKEH